MNKKEITEKLAKLMDDIPEIEGLIALDPKGKLIVGQTLTKMDLDVIAKATQQAFSKSGALGSTISKGNVQSILLTFDEGSSCIVGNDELIIASLQGNDASTSVSLILRTMKSIVE